VLTDTQCRRGLLQKRILVCQPTELPGDHPEQDQEPGHQAQGRQRGRSNGVPPVHHAVIARNRLMTHRQADHHDGRLGPAIPGIRAALEI
jgi:hypothetical protein